ncbi:MAG: LacI family DNA-binding transcriptional regulator [Solirubrobacteraceae bacterium]
MSTESSKRPTHKVQIREVAERAGVSPATVSRILNASPTVGEAYRERVMQAVAELGYRPNRLARNLRRQSAEMIGVVISDIENPHFGEMVRAVEDQAYEKGYRVLLCNTDENPEKQRSYLEILADERVVGAIISPSDPAGPEIAQLLDLGIPVVAFDRVVDDPRADAVIVDNLEGTRQGTQYLIDAGHRRIGFVGGGLGVETGSERLEGYETAMRAAGLEPLAGSGGFRIDGGRTVTIELLEAVPPPTALVVANNLMTAGALLALRGAGLGVPDDIALVATDEPFWAELVDPPLTTLAQPVRQMADAAMSLLLQRVEGRRKRPRKLVFDLELHVRASCGTKHWTDRSQ